MSPEGRRESPHVKDSRVEKWKEAKSSLLSLGIDIINPGIDLSPAFLLGRKTNALII